MAPAETLSNSSWVNSLATSVVFALLVGFLILVMVEPRCLVGGYGMAPRGGFRMTSRERKMASFASQHAHVRFVPVVLQKSAIERPQESRERRFLDGATRTTTYPV